jgi:2-keto-4-pentenoate hydratase/2-oxohepta-3-ene-1,7-dioic acid hydratase in catechol pathway
VNIVRYRANGETHVGMIEGDQVRQAQGEMFERLQIGPVVGHIDDVELLAPVQPSKLIAIGLNYQDHIDEDAFDFTQPENPIVFLKPPSALIGHNHPIVLPAGAEQVEAEAELCIVIGRTCRNVSAENAYDVIFGFTNGNDVSARDYQFKDGQWVRAKGFDTFAPLGPAIVTGVRADDLEIVLRINGERRQSSSTRHLIFDVPFLVEFVSHVMTLLPGDVIMTGTPAGPPKLSAGDVCEVEIAGLGTLRNPVVAG